MTVAGELAELALNLFGTGLPVRLRAWDGSDAGPDHGPVLVLRDRRVLRRLLWNPGELGLAQAYIAGEIDVEGDLGEGLATVWRTAAVARTRPAGRGGRRLAGLRLAVRHGALGPRPPAPSHIAELTGRLNSPERDKQAIGHHYDLSNEFYALLLDPRMAYSCAYWTSRDPGYGLAEAQRDKLDLVCGKLGLTAGARLLDVGCGWGSLALHAAEVHGAEVTAVTLSAQQHAYVSALVADRGLGDRVELRLCDWRDIGGGDYDAAATIEMGEHVGRRNYAAFAAKLRHLLAPGGRLLVQQMSRARDGAPGGGPFIESYIAPDMHMRPLGDTVALLEDAGLEVRHVEAMREHYVRTVDVWITTLEDRWDDVVALVGEPMARVWRLYLAGGRLAFAQGRMGVDQILAAATDEEGVSGMPATGRAAA